MSERDLWLALRQYLREEAEQVKVAHDPYAVRKYANLRRVVTLIESHYPKETPPADRAADNR